MQRRSRFQFLASLLLVRRGWFVNHALENRATVSTSVCAPGSGSNRRASRPPSLRSSRRIFRDHTNCIAEKTVDHRFDCRRPCVWSAVLALVSGSLNLRCGRDVSFPRFCPASFGGGHYVFDYRQNPVEVGDFVRDVALRFHFCGESIRVVQMVICKPVASRYAGKQQTRRVTL